MALSFFHTSSNRGGAPTGTPLGSGQGLVLPNISVAEANSGVTHYACIIIRNTGASIINRAGVYISSDVENARTYIALGLTGKNSTTEQVISTQATPPIGSFVFQKPVFAYSSLAIGLLNPGDWYHLWLKRVINVYAPGEANAYFVLTGTES